MMPFSEILPTHLAGVATALLKMVYSLLRDFNSWRVRIGASYLWSSNGVRRASNSCMGVVHRQYHGILYSKFRCVVLRIIHLFSPTNICQVAELVSAYPTAGGMYYVTKHVVPPEHVAAWAWIIGWCNFLGQAAGVASLAYTISQMILATAVMHTFDQGEASFTP